MGGENARKYSLENGIYKKSSLFGKVMGKHSVLVKKGGKVSPSFFSVAFLYHRLRLLPLFPSCGLLSLVNCAVRVGVGSGWKDTLLLLLGICCGEGGGGGGGGGGKKKSLPSVNMQRKHSFSPRPPLGRRGKAAPSSPPPHSIL